MLQQLHDIFGKQISFRDMCVDHSISVSERDWELEQQYSAFRSAELVVTDRLHGMVFSAITGTPCIFLNSKSPKVLGCYAWLKHLDYIRYCDAPARLGEIYAEMPKGNQTYDNTKLLPYYEQLAQEIKAMLGKR